MDLGLSSETIDAMREQSFPIRTPSGYKIAWEKKIKNRFGDKFTILKRMDNNIGSLQCNFCNKKVCGTMYTLSNGKGCHCEQFQESFSASGHIPVTTFISTKRKRSTIVTASNNIPHKKRSTQESGNLTDEDDTHTFVYQTIDRVEKELIRQNELLTKIQETTLEGKLSYRRKVESGNEDWNKFTRDIRATTKRALTIHGKALQASVAKLRTELIAEFTAEIHSVKRELINTMHEVTE